MLPGWSRGHVRGPPVPQRRRLHAGAGPGLGGRAGGRCTRSNEARDARHRGDRRAARRRRAGGRRARVRATARRRRWRRARPTRRRRTPGCPVTRPPSSCTPSGSGAGPRWRSTTRTSTSATRPDDWPADFSLAVVKQRQQELAALPQGCPSMVLSSTDVAGLWKFGEGQGPEIHGTVGDLAWWLVGRGGGGGADLRRRPRPLSCRPARQDGVMSEMSYTGKVRPGGRPDVRELAEADDHQVLGGRDGQQRLPAALPADRRAAARRRRRRRPRPSSGASAPTGCAASSPPTSTGTTTARWPRWSPPPAPRRRRRRRTPTSCRCRWTCGSRTATVVQVGDCRLEVIRLTRPHPRLHRAAVRRPRRHAAPVHRRLAVPRRRRQDLVTPSDFDVPGRRRVDQAVRPAARRDLVLPRPRRRLDAGRRAPAPRGVARARLVTRPARVDGCPDPGSCQHLWVVRRMTASRSRAPTSKAWSRRC